MSETCDCGHDWEYHGPEVPGCCECDCPMLHALFAPEPADQTRADVVLTEAERKAIASTVWAAGTRSKSPLMRHLLLEVERILADHLAAERAEHAAEVEALRRERDKARDAAKIATESARRRWKRAEAAEATVARVRGALTCPHGEHHYDSDPTCRWCALPSWVEAMVTAALDGERP